MNIPGRQFLKHLKGSGLSLSLLLLCVVLSFLSEQFLSFGNIMNILKQSSLRGLIALGMTLVILTAGIDLSVGSVLAFTAVSTAQLLVNGQPIWLSMLAGLLLGAALGLFNGVLVTRFSVPPFIATLGTMTFVRGLALSFTKGKPVTGLPEGFRYMGTGSPGFVPTPVLIAGTFFLLGLACLRLTVQGERLYAIGSNPRAARFTGIAVKRYVAIVYALSGLLAALAGQILTARLNSAQPVMGKGYEFDAIAAVVVGGTSFSGGRGGLWGTVLGVLIIGVVNNGLNILNISSFWEQVVKGVVIALALLVSMKNSGRVGI